MAAPEAEAEEEAAAAATDSPLQELEEDVLHPRRLLVHVEPTERLHHGQQPLVQDSGSGIGLWIGDWHSRLEQGLE